MASNQRTIVQRLLYGQATYPALDLKNPAIFKAQVANITAFKARWLRVFVTFLLVAVCFAIPALLDRWMDPNWSKLNAIWYVLPIFVIGISLIFFMFQYKCPHCGTVPSGVNWGLGTDGVASYSKGIHLFPIRCGKCGYYLASRALRKDLEQRINKAD